MIIQFSAAWPHRSILRFILFSIEYKRAVQNKREEEKCNEIYYSKYSKQCQTIHTATHRYTSIGFIFKNFSIWQRLIKKWKKTYFLTRNETEWKKTQNLSINRTIVAANELILISNKTTLTFIIYIWLKSTYGALTSIYPYIYNWMEMENSKIIIPYDGSIIVKCHFWYARCRFSSIFVGFNTNLFVSHFIY